MLSADKLLATKARYVYGEHKSYTRLCTIQLNLFYMHYLYGFHDLLWNAIRMETVYVYLHSESLS